ncbi:MAG: hypothetical protein AAB792_01415 [Patescibacteria group bacterium]
MEEIKNIKNKIIKEIRQMISKASLTGLKDKFLPASVLIAALIIGGAWVYAAKLKTAALPADLDKAAMAKLEQKIIPPQGVVLPVSWNDLGDQLIKSGVIDSQKFEQLYAARGGLSDENKKLLYGTDNGKIKITSENSQTLLNLLWALGLGTKNDILEKGPMMDPKFKGAGNFASTGGWTLALGKAMDHYSMHPFIVLTKEQQALVEQISQNIYRPCCGNSTYFPDCNHGMAMLGLLELMASQGVSEKEMYNAALAVNAYWFPDTYLTIGKYLNKKGMSWDKVGAQKILGFDFSSGSGYAQIRSEVEPVKPKSGGGCGV